MFQPFLLHMKMRCNSDEKRTIGVGAFGFNFGAAV